MENVMKTKQELLYIPNGNYMTFYLEKKSLGCFGEYLHKWNIEANLVIEKILEGTFNPSFFERNGLPDKDQLEKNHFEIVNK